MTEPPTTPARDSREEFDRQGLSNIKKVIADILIGFLWGLLALVLAAWLHSR